MLAKGAHSMKTAQRCGFFRLWLGLFVPMNKPDTLKQGPFGVIVSAFRFGLGPGCLVSNSLPDP